MLTFSITVTLRNLFNRTRFHSSASDPSSFLLNLLDFSIETHSLALSQQSHARAQRSGLTQHPLVAQKLIFSCSEFKRPYEALLVFDSLVVKNTHICNTLLSGYGKNRIFHKSLVLFREMCDGSILPQADEFTFSVVFKIVGDFSEVLIGKMVHGRGVKSGLVLDTVVGNSLLSMYDRSGCFDDSLKVFEEMPVRNASSWNALISSYAKVNVERGNRSPDRFELWNFVKGMQNEGLRFDAFTVSTLLSLFSADARSDDNSSYKCNHGRELHTYIVKTGLDSRYGSDSDVHLGCCLIDMYSKNGEVDVGKRVFDRMKLKNVYAWTAMINGYVHCGQFDEALFLFREMQWGGVGTSKVSLVAILPACSSSVGFMGGKQIHGFAVRRELNHEVSLTNALLDTYSKCGNLNYATRVFDYECIDKDAISWSSIIYGYGLHGQGKYAVDLFDKMLQSGIKPDSTVVVGVLSACSRSGLIHDGIRIYDLVVADYMVRPTVKMCACVADMLGRSGQLDRALDFIRNMPVEPGPSIWGALLCASAIHGNSEMQELAYRSLIQIEPDNSSNYISLSNLYAASKRWDVVAEVRKVMKERGLRKLPGCSWISINNATHSFVVSDKSHLCSDSIYTMLDALVSAMNMTCYNPDFVHLMEAGD